VRESPPMVHDQGPDAARLPDAQLAMAWHFAALLLHRPDEAVISRLEPVHRASHLLPDEVGGPLRATVVHLERAPLPQLQQEYAETFSAGGPEIVADLCRVLEQAANVAADLGRSMLAGRRPVLESLHSSLLHMDSGWVGAVAAVTATFPRDDGEPAT
jgi:nitrate reductase assembly molybdenum cofactor insertion protein NarJ